MSDLGRISAVRCAVVVVDVQERLAQAMPEATLADLLRSARIILRAARLLGASTFYTEQYPQGLGTTLREVRSELDAASATRFEKVSFSAWDVPQFAEALRGSGVDTVVLLGMEAHVCVFQSARDLVQQGFGVQVLVDGVCSRRADHREVGLSLCERSGAILSTTETVVFDWLRLAGTNEFKEISSLVR